MHVSFLPVRVIVHALVHMPYSTRSTFKRAELTYGEVWMR